MTPRNRGRLTNYFGFLYNISSNWLILFIATYLRFPYIPIPIKILCIFLSRAAHYLDSILLTFLVFQWNSNLTTLRFSPCLVLGDERRVFSINNQLRLPIFLLLSRSHINFKLKFKTSNVLRLSLQQKYFSIFNKIIN